MRSSRAAPAPRRPRPRGRPARAGARAEGRRARKRGEFAAGVETIRAGLSLALEHELTTEAAELYQRLGTAFEIAARLRRRARRARDRGRLVRGDRRRRRWSTRASAAWRTCSASSATGTRRRSSAASSAPARRGADDALVADGVLGSILAFRGDARGGPAARALPRDRDAPRRRVDGVDSAAALAWIDATRRHRDRGRDCRVLLERWERSEDHHYAVWGLRWAAWVFARTTALARARACAEALSAIAAEAGHPDALAALAHALGETALAEGDADAAAEQLAARSSSTPTSTSRSSAPRSRCAPASRSRRPASARRRWSAWRRPTARPAARRTAARRDGRERRRRLGESLERRLGRRAAAEHERGGLSRRELEVMARRVGRTNREIARELFLSPRTVDMHVRNILLKLSCRTRAGGGGGGSDLRPPRPPRKRQQGRGVAELAGARAAEVVARRGGSWSCV